MIRDLTITGVKVTPCTMAKDQWTTELETAEGVRVDPWFVTDLAATATSADEETAARRLIGKRLRVDGFMCLGALTARTITDLGPAQTAPAHDPATAAQMGLGI